MDFLCRTLYNRQPIQSGHWYKWVWQLHRIQHRNCMKIVRFLCWILCNYQTRLYQRPLWFGFGGQTGSDIENDQKTMRKQKKRPQRAGRSMWTRRGPHGKILIRVPLGNNFGFNLDKLNDQLKIILYFSGTDT